MSPRIIPIPWKTVECIFLRAGFVFDRQIGDHRMCRRKGCPRSVVIPMWKEVSEDIIHSNMRTADMSREEYFAHLKDC